MNPLLAGAILLVALTGLVVFTMAVENWARIIQPLAADEPADEPVDAPVSEPPEVAEVAAPAGSAPTDAPAAGTPARPAQRLYTAPPRPTPAAHFRVHLVHPVPAAGIPDGAVRTTPTALVLRDQDTADVIAGLLFAAFAVSRRAGADRAAAWVTAAATPPSLDPARYPPDVDLRGRPARVAELLAADDAGVTWVTLRRSVDIARGVGRSPVRQPTLSGLLVWWEATRSLPSVIPVGEVARLADAVERIEEHLAGTPWADVVASTSAALVGARDRQAALLLAPAVAPEPDDDAHDGLRAPDDAGTADLTPAGAQSESSDIGGTSGGR